MTQPYPAPRFVVTPEPLVTIIVTNGPARARRSYDRTDRWRIEKVKGESKWVAWPITPGVYVNVFTRQQWIEYNNGETALRDVLRRVYSK